MSELPPDPFLNQDFMMMAKSAREMYEAFIANRFTNMEAMQLVTAIVTTMIAAAQNTPGSG